MQYILTNITCGASAGAFIGLAIAFAIASVRAYKDKAYASMAFLCMVAVLSIAVSMVPAYELLQVHANSTALLAFAPMAYATYWCLAHSK